MLLSSDVLKMRFSGGDVKFDVDYVWTSFSDRCHPQGSSRRSHIPIKHEKFVKPDELQDGFIRTFF